MHLALLREKGLEIGISISDKELELFSIYLRELKEWNERFNLTAIRDDEGIIIKHFLDSLTPSGLIKSGSALLDIGSGGGFPAIPLKIVSPSLKVTAIDSVNKKVTFMNHVISTLGLTGIEALHVRAEDLAKTRKGAFDVVISRALSSLKDFIRIGEPLLAYSGCIISMKGKSAQEEIKDAETIMKKRNLAVQEVLNLSLPQSAGDRSIICIHRT